MKKELLMVGFMMVMMVGLMSCNKEEQSEEVFYKIGSEAITWEKVNRTWLSLSDDLKRKYMSREGRRELLDNLVARELLYQGALEQKLDEDPVIKFKLEQSKKNILIEEIVERSIKPEELYLYYQDNFVLLDVIKLELRHPQDKAEKERVRGQAEQVYGQLSKGIKFDQLKRQYSPEAKGVEAGYVSRDNIISNFGADCASAIFGLKKEENFTKPIFIKDGWYIFYVKEKPGNLNPLGYEFVVDEVLEVKREETFRGMINDLRSRITVKSYPENIERFLKMGEKQEELSPEEESQAGVGSKSEPVSSMGSEAGGTVK